MAKEFSFEELDGSMSKIDSLGSVMTKNTYSKIDEWIGTGNYLLNAQISGSVFKGIPNSRSIVFSGVSGCGKTFMILNALREAQKMGYYAIYGDSEAAVDEDLMVKFNIDPSKVRYQPLKTVIQTRHFIANLCQQLKEKKAKGFEIPKIMMIIDSLGNLATEKETADALSGSDKRDMTKQQNLKSMFRIITTDLAELKIPLLVTNHVYASIGGYFPSNVQAGGCMVPGTLIQTTKGLMKIEDIKPGDFVITMDGEKEVTHTWKFDDSEDADGSPKKTWEIEFEDGIIYTVSEDHRFLINEEWEKDSSWKKVWELSENDEVITVSEIKKLKVKRVTESSYTRVHDLTVKDAQHYITENGVVSHNTGAIYNASIILEFTKAGLKDGDEEAADAGQSKTGLVVTSKVVKNRFVKPIPIKFHISFYKGMNPYVGLENYVSWEACGIGRGKLIEEIHEELQWEDEEKTIPKMYRGKQKVIRTNTGNYIYEADPKANTFAVKHLGRTVKGSALFSAEVFTKEVLEGIDKVIAPIFQFPKTVLDQGELEDMFNLEDEEETSTSHEKLFNQAETVEEVNKITEEATNSTPNEA